MTDSKKRQKQRRYSKEMQELLKDESNIFMIQNPQVLPPLTKASESILKQLLHSTSINSFKKRSQGWVNHLTQDRKIKQMVLRIKQVTPNIDDNNQKYLVQIHPTYVKASVGHLVSNSTFLLSTSLFNLTKSSFKDYSTYFKWNYRQSYLSILGQLSLYSPWVIGGKKTWGKPLDKNWVTDCRQFSLQYILPSDTRRTGRDNLKQSLLSSLFFKLKGYETRLGRLVSQMPGTYLNTSSLKSVDIIEAGYNRRQTINNGNTALAYRIGLGTDYYNTWYCKLMGKVTQVFKVNKRVNIIASGEVGLIEGKNLIPHEMFSRNQSKWMGERSKVYGHCRFDIFGRGIPIFQTIELLPSNYLSIWASKSSENKVKMQLQLGISFSALRSPFRFDINFLKISGIKGQPRFGLKYEF